MSHALIRTSPKGTPFIGRCLKCGDEGLGMSDALKDCPSDNTVSDEQALLEILDAEPSETRQETDT